MGSDLSIVQAARGMPDAEWRPGEGKGTDTSLINYLQREEHTSPFEFAEFHFEVQLPIFVCRQWHRHRTWTYNEISARYGPLPEMYYVPKLTVIGQQAKTNKQARDLNVDIPFSREFERSLYKLTCWLSFKVYKFLLWRKWPRELARAVLPLATYTRMQAKVDLSNLIKFIQLRKPSNAQYEIRVYANALEKLITPIVPVTMKAYEE
jgi:thymidylate synthase (FAD)